jgi:hypothetical protein
MVVDEKHLHSTNQRSLIHTPEADPDFVVGMMTGWRAEERRGGEVEQERRATGL